MCELSIESDCLRVTVTRAGGNLVSVWDKRRAMELLWQPDPQAWRFQDVVIFPLIGLPAHGYDVLGNTYQFQMPHGVARWETFEVDEHSGDRLVLRLESNEETLRRYPFRFRLRMIYQLSGNRLSITYGVTSTEGEKMPYQVGAHAGFQTGGDEVSVRFEGGAKVYHYPYDGVIHRPPRLLAEDGCLVLDRKVFDEKKSLVLPRPDCDRCTVQRPDGIQLRYDLGDAPSLTIWGFANGGRFLCVEPWWGICEGESTPRELEQKEQMFFAAREEVCHTYAVEVL